MKKPANKNVAASVHQRLLNVARETGRPFNEVLQYFANEVLEEQWIAFLDKTGVSGPESFHETLDQIEGFLGPLFEHVNILK